MILLFIAAVVWGVAFVAQSVGIAFVPGFTFNCIRFIMGGVVLIPCIYFMEKKRSSETADSKRESRRDLLVSGGLCGFCLFAAGNLQQFGIAYTTAGKAGFITAFYIVIVPVISVLLGKKITPKIVGAVLLALLGLYLLCITGTFTVSKGDMLIFGSAFVFSAHILLVDHFSARVSGLKLSCVQFFVCGILSGIMMLIFEEPTMTGIMQAKIPLLYAGVMSCGVAYTFQVLGQKHAKPTVASLILSLEASISVLAGWLILGERLTGRELMGCAIMFLAIILAQLPEKKRQK